MGSMRVLYSCLTFDHWYIMMETNPLPDDQQLQHQLITKQWLITGGSLGQLELTPQYP